eukprot:3668106-Alexandrium_andersonii.AAC.1
MDITQAVEAGHYKVLLEDIRDTMVKATGTNRTAVSPSVLRLRESFDVMTEMGDTSRETFEDCTSDEKPTTVGPCRICGGGGALVCSLCLLEVHDRCLNAPGGD